MQKTTLVTGAAGFIGFHTSLNLLKRGVHVVGVDSLTDYYDVDLKKRRIEELEKYDLFTFVKASIDSDEFVSETLEFCRPDVVIHLAAQAGVRYSIDNPRAYVDANLIGTFNILELSKRASVSHLLAASTSSVYGSNTNMPFDENQKCDTPLSFYAATKKANEAMYHSYAHIHGIPITAFRFFTVYGPWGRPDMALFKFIKAIDDDQPIDIYNNGKMVRDFTYVDDLVEAIVKLTECIPSIDGRDLGSLDSISDVAPFRVVNIGNSDPVDLMSYINALETSIGKVAKKNFMPMQPGDVHKTYASVDLLEKLTNYRPSTPIEVGVKNFVDWYKSFYK